MYLFEFEIRSMEGGKTFDVIIGQKPGRSTVQVMTIRTAGKPLTLDEIKAALNGITQTDRTPDDISRSKTAGAVIF